MIWSVKYEITGIMEQNKTVKDEIRQEIEKSEKIIQNEMKLITSEMRLF